MESIVGMAWAGSCRYTPRLPHARRPDTPYHSGSRLPRSGRRRQQAFAYGLGGPWDANKVASKITAEGKRAW